MSDNKPDTLQERFGVLSNLFAPMITASNATITDNDINTYNYEFFIDLLIAVYTDIQRLVKFFRNNFCIDYLFI